MRDRLTALDPFPSYSSAAEPAAFPRIADFYLRTPSTIQRVGLDMRRSDSGDHSGTLTQKSGALGCINETGASSCTVGPNQLLGAQAVTLSPDVYEVQAGCLCRKQRSWCYSAVFRGRTNVLRF